MTEDMQCYIPGDLNTYSLISMFYFYKLEHLALLSYCVNLGPRAGSFWLRFRIQEYTKSFICIPTHTPTPTNLSTKHFHPITLRKLRLPEFPFHQALKTSQPATKFPALSQEPPRNQPNPLKSLNTALVGAE